MEKTLNRQELEEQLSGKAESIGRRLEALQQEVGSLSARRFIEDRPLVSAAIVIAGGFLMGLLFGRRKRPKPRKSAGNLLDKDLVEQYIETVASEADRLVSRGKDVPDAVSKALRGRAPLLVYKGDDGHAERGFVREAIDLALKSATGFAVKSIIDYASTRMRFGAETEGEVGSTMGSPRPTDGGQPPGPDAP